MNITDIIIIALIAALLIFTVVYNIRKRKNGGCGCCSAHSVPNRSSCGGCACGCSSQEEKKS